MRKPVSQRQFLDEEILVVAWEDTASLTPVVTKGGFQATVVRSAGTGTRDRITITFKKPIFGMTPTWFAQAGTLDCEFRDVAGTSDKTKIVIDGLKSTNLSTAVEDAAGSILIIGPSVTKEGNY